jgi:hypothetical protein
MGIGWDYGFIKDKDYESSNLNIDYLMGVHLHEWNTAILAGIRFNIDKMNLDTGGQVEHFFGFYNSRRLTGFGASLGGGVQLLSDFNLVTVPYIRVGGLWHFGTIVKFALEFDYRFNGQISAGIIASFPSVTAITRLNNYKRIYLERNKVNKTGKDKEQIALMLSIGNMLDIPLIHIYVSYAGKNEWKDILNGGSVLKEKAVTFEELFPIRYDIRVEDADGNTYTFLDVNLARDGLAIGRMFVIDSTTKRDQ